MQLNSITVMGQADIFKLTTLQASDDHAAVRMAMQAYCINSASSYTVRAVLEYGD